MIANEITLHRKPIDKEFNKYMSLNGLQQWAQSFPQSQQAYIDLTVPYVVIGTQFVNSVFLCAQLLLTRQTGFSENFSKPAHVRKLLFHVFHFFTSMYKIYSGYQ